MDNHLRILMIEDSENDAHLIVRHLQKANYSVEFERVETADRMSAALSDRPWDFIFSDYTMPQFNAFAALKLLQESGRDIPFIVISGTSGEETAVEIMKLGAHDYLMKDTLARLVPVIKREIEDTRSRKQRRMTEKALMESETRFSSLIETARDIIFSLAPDGKITTLNPSFETVSGWPSAEWIGRPFMELLFPEDIPIALDRFSRVIAGEPNVFTELRVRTKGRGVIQVEVIVTRRLQNGELIELLGIARDVSERKEAEMRLRRNEALLSDAMKIARLGPWEQDVVTGKYIFNDHFYDVFRTTAKEVGGYTMSSAEYVKRFVHPDDAVWVQREIQNSLISPELETSHHLEHRMLYANGETGYLDASIFIVKDENGRLTRRYGVNQDITARKKAELALRRNEALLSDTMKIASLGPWEYNVERDIFTFNDHFYAIFRTTAADVGGYTMSSAEYTRRFVHPDDVALVGLEIGKALATTDLQYSQRMEHRMIYANGEIGYLEVTIFVVKDKDGHTVRTYGVNQDVTVRKASEKALRESEERYRQFFEDDLTGDFISTVGGKILSCNPAFARIYGFESVEEVLRTNAESFYFSRVDRESLLALLREKRKLEYYEEVAKRKDGKTIYLVSNQFGIFNDKGELVQIKGYIFDNTERRLLEDQLRQSQKMESIGTLAGGIAHDFNNILNNILGFVMQLKKYAHDPVKVMKYGETIERSATRGAELSAHLLSVSRMKKREESEFNVGLLINEVASLCTETFPRSITITQILGEELVPIKGDRGSLYQVLLNLTVNARDAMPNGGTLTIEARTRLVGQDVNMRLLPPTSTRCIEIKVADTGCGMSEAVREKMFDPFFTTKEQGKGTGLGLSIVYNIVKEHHGTILVESEEGAGTAFKVYLPAVEPAPVRDESSGVSAATGGELVLLVDDEEMMQELGKELLEDNGYRVLIAKDGVEAVEQYRERGKEIALVILDLVMPRMDGGQTYMELKKINKNVRAFFCSGFTSDKVITQLLEEEHLQAIKKPFHPTDFIKMVQSTMHGN